MGQSEHFVIHTADNQQKLVHQCLDSVSIETIELLLQYGANIDAFCDKRSPDERGQVTETRSPPMSVGEILRRVYPDKSRLLTLLAEARERRSRWQLHTGILELQDTSTTLRALDLHRTSLKVQSDALRSDYVKATGRIVETQGVEIQCQKPEPEKRKRGWRLWAFFNRVFA